MVMGEGVITRGRKDCLLGRQGRFGWGFEWHGRTGIASQTWAFHSYLVSTYCVQGTALGPGAVAVNKTKGLPSGDKCQEVSLGRRHLHRDPKEVREGSECRSPGGVSRHREQPDRSWTRTCPHRGHGAGVEDQKARKVCRDRVRTERR